MGSIFMLEFKTPDRGVWVSEIAPLPKRVGSCPALLLLCNERLVRYGVDFDNDLKRCHLRRLAGATLPAGSIRTTR
jgi:hypothetical protein